MKLRWIREIGQELNGDPQADLPRREVVREMRSQVDWSRCFSGCQDAWRCQVPRAITASPPFLTVVWLT
jgi:hypothetical protein